MTTLDEAFGDATPVGKPAASLDDAFSEYDREQKHKAGVELIRQRAQEIQPPQAAKVIQLNRQTGLPTDVIGRNLSDVERQAQQDARQQSLDKYPTMRWLYANDPTSADLLQNDIERIGQITMAPPFAKKPTAADFPMDQMGGFKPASQALRQAQDQREVELTDYTNTLLNRPIPTTPELSDYYGSYVKGALEMLGGQVAGAGETLKIYNRNIPKAGGFMRFLGTFADLFGSNVEERVGQFGKEYGQDIKDVGAEFGAPPARQTLGTDVIEGVGQLGTQLAEYMVAPGVAIPAMFAQGVDQVSATVEGDDASQQNKDLASLIGGVVTVTSEKFAIDKLLERIPPQIKNDILRKVADVTIAGGIEAGQEYLERLGHETAQHLLTNPDAPWMEGIDREMTAAGLSAALIRGILGGNVRTPANRMRQEQAKAQAAEQYHQNLQAVVEEINQTEAASLGVEGQSAIAKALQPADADANVTIDAQTFSQILEQSGIPLQEVMQTMPAVADQYVMAAARSGDLVIPTAEFVAHLSQTPAIGPLLENVRQDPEAMTMAEANTMAQEQTERFIAEAEKIAAEKVEDAVWQESKRAVETELQRQMDEAGAYSKDANQKYTRLVSAFYETMAAKDPVRFANPEAAMKAYPLVFQNGRFVQPTEGAFEQAEQVQGQPIDIQNQDQTETIDPEIIVEAINSKTGKTVQIKELASVAMKEVDERINRLEELIKCLE